MAHAAPAAERRLLRRLAPHPANAAPLPPMPALPCPADSKVTWGIHREAPLFVDQGVEQTVLTTGIKVGGWAAGWVQDGA